MPDTRDGDDTPRPKVSVVMTLFNRETLLAESIESVLGQTWKDFELIIVDDCSTDRSLEIAERYLSDGRVSLFRNPENLGDYGNRNRGASLARGEFLKFHDSDDVMYPHCLEFMIRPLAAEPRAAFALTASRSWEGGRVPMLLTPELAFEREFHGTGMFNGGPANALFRSAMFNSSGGFEDIGPASDHLFWLCFSATHSVLLVNADLFYYRRHESQELASDRAVEEHARRTKDAGRTYWTRARLQGYVWRFLVDGRSPLRGQSLDRAKSNWLWILTKETWRDIKRGRFDLASMRLSTARIGVAEYLAHFRTPKRDLNAGTPGTTELTG